MSDSDRSAQFAATLRFHNDLRFFLKRDQSEGEIVRTLREKSSVKDVIESYGVPHPEVDLILCDGVPRGFEFHLISRSTVDVYSVERRDDYHPAHRLQRRDITRFVVDGHLGKLARDLRLLGFDTVYRCDAGDAWLLQIAVEEERALLTRDRRLLMHKVVRHGYCPRSDFVEEQVVEVVRRFDIIRNMRAFTRCLRCNGALERVEKTAMIERLEPLTKIFYEDFRRCSECAHVFWAGSHFAKLEARIEHVRAAFQ